MSKKVLALITAPKFIWSAIVLLLAFSFYLFVIDASTRQLVDLEIYYKAAQLLQQGENIYNTPVMVQNRWGYMTQGYYLYPPILAFALSILPNIEYQTIKFCWCVLAWLSIAGSAACLAGLLAYSRNIKIPYPSRFALLLFFCICFEPVYSGVSDGQVAALILLCISGFFLCYAANTFYLAGALLGIAASIKITPALLLLVPLKTKRWGVLLSFFVIGVTLLLLPTLATNNPHVLNDFIGYLQGMSVDGRHRDFPFNYAFDKAILLPFGLEEAVYLRWLIKGLVLALPIFVVAKARITSIREALTYLGFVSCCMVLSSPIMWFHHLAWALPAIVVFALNNEHTGERLIRHYTLAIGYLFAISQTHLIQFQVFMNNPAGLKYTTLVPGVLVLTLACNLLSSISSGGSKKGSPLHLP
ncbi:MAG: DUF2029 domain-containing protein [Oligoflexia bacterium]|nr:DUF2029 domain-containing protein [Oligoflexia bacterium]